MNKIDTKEKNESSFFKIGEKKTSKKKRTFKKKEFVLLHDKILQRINRLVLFEILKEPDIKSNVLSI